MQEDDYDLLSYMPVKASAQHNSEERYSAKEKRFIACFNGEAVYSMRVAGWLGTDEYLRHKCKSLLAQPKIQHALRTRADTDAAVNMAVMNKNERLEMLSALARGIDPYAKEEVDTFGNPIDVKISISERLKSLELLGKAGGDFVQKIDINHNISVSDLILESYNVRESVETIEAQYIVLRDQKKKENAVISDELEGLV